jgi:hypothetical protein
MPGQHGAEGPGQLLVGIGDLGSDRGRDGCAPAPRRGRAISTPPSQGPRGIGLGVVGYLGMPPHILEG